MTETINKYNNGKIYKIISYSNPDLVYYGSTIQPLSKRMGLHRVNNRCSSKQIIELGDAKILLVENYSCNSKEELHRKEGEYILNNNCINKMVAGRTDKEWYQANKERQKENQRKYQQANKEIVKEKKRIYQEANKETLKEKKKIYKEANKDLIKQKNKEYKLKKKLEKLELEKI